MLYQTLAGCIVGFRFTVFDSGKGDKVFYTEYYRIYCIQVPVF